MDSPAAWVTTSLPSTVTLTMAAFRCASAIVSRTIRITASALLVSVVLVGDSGPTAAGVQLVNTTRAHIAVMRRRTTGMPGSWQSNPVECVN